MRVLHVINSLDPEIGGPPAVVNRLAAAQAAIGMQVGILFYDRPSARERIEKSISGIPGFKSVSLHTLSAPSTAETIFGSNAGAYVMQQAKDVDVFHLHGVWEAILRASAKSARALNKPYVIAPHGMLDPWSMQQKKLKKQIALALGYRTMLNRASLLHTLNADEKDLLTPLKLTAAAAIIPNGIFLEEIEPAPPKGTFANFLPSIKDKPYILFLSRLHYKKGLDHLAAAFSQVATKMPEVHLVVAGPDGGARSDFDQRITQAGLTNRVHVIGPVYGQQKLAALVDASCFCLPSRQEGFSVAITEALACAVPVVISTACHFPEVNIANAGIVTELEPGQIAAALLKILSDPQARIRMGQAGREMVLSRYTWRSIAQLTQEHYRTCLAEINRP